MTVFDLSSTPYFPVPVYVIAVAVESCVRFSGLSKEVNCVRATKRDEVTVDQGTARLNGAHILMHWPPLHEAFQMGE